MQYLPVIKSSFRFFSIFLLLLSFASRTKAQNGVYFIPTTKQADSVRRVLTRTKNDTLRMSACDKRKDHAALFYYQAHRRRIGLGLSLTYDMVVKGHGGSIQVNSVNGEGAEFIISLPLNL